MDWIKYLIIIAIPLNFLGFMIKHLSKIPNYLIVIIVTICAYFAVKYLTYKLNLVEPTNATGFIIGNTISVSSLAVFNKDLASSIRKGVLDLMGIIKKTQLLEGSMEERLKAYRRGLLKKALTILFTDILMLIICFSVKFDKTQIMDYLIYTTLISLGTVLIEDLINKSMTDKEKLNVQYFIVFVLAWISIGAISVAWFSSSWNVFIGSIVLSSFCLGLAFFLAHWSYIPSLRSKDEVLQDLMDKKWLVYKKMTQEEMIEDMLTNIKYYFKKDLWGAELDLSNPMFLDSEGAPQATKAAAYARSDQSIINKSVEYFQRIIATKDQVVKK